MHTHAGLYNLYLLGYRETMKVCALIPKQTVPGKKKVHTNQVHVNSSGISARFVNSEMWVLYRLQAAMDL